MRGVVGGGVRGVVGGGVRGVVGVGVRWCGRRWVERVW